MPRFGILLLVLGVLAAAQFVLASVAFVEANSDDERGFAFPLPERVRNLVVLMDRAAPSMRTALAQAFDDEQVDIEIVSENPAREQADESANLPGMEAILQSYLAAIGDREVNVWIAPDDPDEIVVPRLGPGRLWSRYPLRMTIELEDGAWLLIETRGNLAQRVFGFPPGLWAGLFGVTLAFFSLWILWRSISPLTGLASALDRFAATQIPHPVRPRGPEETRRIINAVNRMQNEISRSISERRVMFGALSHDLRTILTRLSLRAAAIENDSIREGAERDLAAMNEIVEDALAFTRLDSMPDLLSSSVNLEELLYELRQAYPVVPVSERYPATLSPQDIVLACDGPELFRALQNLVENALTHASGAELDVVCEGAHCRFDVMDRGPGFASEDSSELIKPFIRGKAATTKGVTGSGLGLAIVQRIAKRAKAEFDLLDRDGGGAIARLSVPRHE